MDGRAGGFEGRGWDVVRCARRCGMVGRSGVMWCDLVCCEVPWCRVARCAVNLYKRKIYSRTPDLPSASPFPPTI